MSLLIHALDTCFYHTSPDISSASTALLGVWIHPGRSVHFLCALNSQRPKLRVYLCLIQRESLPEARQFVTEDARASQISGALSGGRSREVLVGNSISARLNCQKTIFIWGFICQVWGGSLLNTVKAEKQMGTCFADNIFQDIFWIFCIFYINA